MNDSSLFANDHKVADVESNGSATDRVKFVAIGIDRRHTDDVDGGMAALTPFRQLRLRRANSIDVGEKSSVQQESPVRQPFSIH